MKFRVIFQIYAIFCGANKITAMSFPGNLYNDKAPINPKSLLYYPEDHIPRTNSSKTDMHMLLKIESINPIDSNKLEVTVKISLQLFWRENLKLKDKYEKLKSEDSDSEERKTCRQINFNAACFDSFENQVSEATETVFSETQKDSDKNQYSNKNDFWVPDLEICGTRSDSDFKFTQSILQRYNKTENILSFKTIFDIKMRCGQRFHFYPLDTQGCDVKIQSLVFNLEDLELFWHEYQGHLIQPEFYNGIKGF